MGIMVAAAAASVSGGITNKDDTTKSNNNSMNSNSQNGGSAVTASTSNMTTSTTTNTTTNSTLKKKILKKKSVNYGQHCDNTLSPKSKMSFIKDKSFFQEKQKKEVSLGCIHGNYVKPSVSNGSTDSHDMLLKHLGNGNFGSYPFSGSGNGNGNGNHVRRIGIAFGSNFFHQFGDHAVSLWDVRDDENDHSSSSSSNDDISDDDDDFTTKNNKNKTHKRKQKQKHTSKTYLFPLDIHTDYNKIIPLRKRVSQIMSRTPLLSSSEDITKKMMNGVESSSSAATSVTSTIASPYRNVERFKSLNFFSMSSWALSPTNLSSSIPPNDDVDPDTTNTATTPTATNNTTPTTANGITLEDNHPSLYSEKIQKQIMKKNLKKQIKAQGKGKWVSNISSPQVVAKDRVLVPLPHFALSNGDGGGGGNSTNTNRKRSMAECLLPYSRIIHEHDNNNSSSIITTPSPLPQPPIVALGACHSTILNPPSSNNNTTTTSPTNNHNNNNNHQPLLYQTGTIHGYIYNKPTILPCKLPLFPCIEISCGRRHTVGLFRSDGYPSPRSSSNRKGGNVSSSSNSNSATGGAGIVMTWGSGYFGQLGHGTDISHVLEPKIVERLLPKYVGDGKNGGAVHVT